MCIETPKKDAGRVVKLFFLRNLKNASWKHWKPSFWGLLYVIPSRNQTWLEKPAMYDQRRVFEALDFNPTTTYFFLTVSSKFRIHMTYNIH